MSSVMVILLIIITITILLLIYAIIFNIFQNYIVRINEVESNIDNTLRDKFDILNRAVKVFKSNEKNYQVMFNKLEELKEQQLSSFDFDRALTELTDEFCQLNDSNEKKKSNQTYKKICIELKETDEKILAYKHYYNDNITKFNKLVKIFPTNLVGKISHFKEKPFYDGKDLTDEIINDFKI